MAVRRVQRRINGSSGRVVSRRCQRQRYVIMVSRVRQQQKPKGRVAGTAVGGTVGGGGVAAGGGVGSRTQAANSGR